MNSPRSFVLLLIALLVLCFGLAAGLAPRFHTIETNRRQTGNFFSLLLGDSSRMFANSFFVKADEYYHSGYYPTIFDNNSAFKTPHLAEDTGAVSSNNHGEETGFMGAPRNWIDAFGRHFMPNRHTHLDAGGASGDERSTKEVQELLPWLKLASKLDPENIQTYTVTAYWLRQRLQQPDQAEQVLREGLRNNPQSMELLFELGRLYNESRHDPEHARNVWELAARYWSKMTPDEQKEHEYIFEQVAAQLGRSEEEAGHWSQAVEWFEAAKKYSPEPDEVQKLIDEVKAKMAAPASTPPTPPLET